MNKRKWFFTGVLVLLLSMSYMHGSGSDVEISGSDGFIKQVSQALSLLKKKAPDAYTIVTRYIGRIEQGQKSGMWAYRNPPTFEIADRTTFYSVTWCAGAIAHDSYHSKLYHEYRQNHGQLIPADVWTGFEAEKKCLRHQWEVLKKINAPECELKYLSRLDGTHPDVNNDGKLDWKDYTKRNW